jgi:demethylmenaquinone methyltransferase / 2-methoxy-6-polyprenyl-1,4-benzoquinol methylase
MSSPSLPPLANDALANTHPASTVLLPSTEAKAGYVQSLFNRIAPTYDLLNDCISFGTHRLWKRKACNALQLQAGQRVADICTGTGHLLHYLAKDVGPSGEAIGIDFSEGMLEVARRNLSKTPQVSLMQGDAMALPLPSETLDGAIMAFGLRNLQTPERGIQEMARILKPQGKAVCLDTHPNPKLPGFWFYFRYIMPRIGQIISQDPTAYQYLQASTQAFLNPVALRKLFEEAGFQKVEVHELFGGTATLIVATK